jgi:peptide-methionine (R)-S-oxide reductase
LFDSTIKFSSGTGWPSFTQPIKDNAIKYERDSAFGMVHVEVMCNTCDGHLGHVFPQMVQNQVDYAIVLTLNLCN